ncbi:hypothetical protein YpMG051020_3892 [Yersinia pestis biovar Orientalis str. MG05-1020]|uniref:Uncharacterized protein n=1 Tax=Yersinia pestis biovar Orientalis str. IP275 TaxID=373665 RepID=A0AAV3BDR5_YERPE|nr:hypothetical protein YpAngola_A2956 [Yersinia pestis Angola]EDR32819.1 hypothetical protein YPIP275_2576 [Yersinia pestis biovar Orientalis str. IP275]EDR37238.1 hypothetical protein YpF1991016_4362 [Yersinia pestis biovar Orientalis str. F1991016]EDR56062.1 hypothetical protein YpMG051020_3892 [Yersinia pestis biovar Orientalis str. MG05-1020]
MALGAVLGADIGIIGSLPIKLIPPARVLAAVIVITPYEPVRRRF